MTKSEVALEGLKKIARLRMKAAERDRTLAELELALLHEVSGPSMEMSIHDDDEINQATRQFFNRIRSIR